MIYSVVGAGVREERYPERPTDYTCIEAPDCGGQREIQ